jgi:5-methylcytosine-specific restriction endonuclease McrA
MGATQRVTIEQIVEAYRSTGSVWKTAKVLGVCGQSVHERLRAIDYPMGGSRWTKEEYEELAELAKTCTISRIAEQLGRPYYGVAIKLSRLGLANRFGNRQKRTVRRGTGLNKETVSSYAKQLSLHPGTLRQFCRMNSLGIDTLVAAFQKYTPDFWNEYAQKHSELQKEVCPYCNIDYYPMSAKQKTCSRKCTADAKRDAEYFGGNRRNTIGLAEGVCQLCLQHKEKGLSSHHVLGKENDPDNTCLVALCPGCHQLVGQLAGRKFVDTNEGWENLITLVMGRRMAENGKEYVGAFASVDLEYLKAEDLAEEIYETDNPN